MTVLFALISGMVTGNLAAQISLQVEMMVFGYFLWPLMPPFMVSAFLGAVAELLQEELAVRTEVRLMAQQSYEAIRRQNQEVMLLRHDMAKHYGVLRQMTGQSCCAGPKKDTAEK